ncbi:hypothetical protein F5888DRAFT_1702522 [Russula emetica]|nr:hypothetical protein F5888DRAFT_1702522 [Russula emetica]
MLYKPLVALFMALAATGGVAASATPVRRGGGGGYYPPPAGPTIPAGDCNSNTALYCCNSLTSTSNPRVGLITNLVGLEPDLLAGLDCADLGVVSDNPSCAANSVCCTNTYQNGLVNIGCTQVSL